MNESVMLNLKYNRDHWDGKYDWPQQGEEWSLGWGGSAPQWWGSIFPRIHAFLPAERILEIAPGYGRWTEYLLPFARSCYRGVDMADKCALHCGARFKDSHPDIKVISNDGLSLNGVADMAFDFMFSFDSLVHAAQDIIDLYVKQILDGLLAPDGVCFLHHSNYSDAEARHPEIIGKGHWRSKCGSAEKTANCIRSSGGRILCQEIIDWCGVPEIDSFTLFCNRGARFKEPETLFINSNFYAHESVWASNIVSKYCFE